jgi:methyl-accepting chemotaxis protein
MDHPENFKPRRRYFVNWAIQGNLILGILVSVILSAVLVFLDYYLSFGRNAGWDPAMLEIFLKAQTLPVAQLVVFTFVLVFVTLFLSHRVAGPLVNLEKSLARLGEGDLTIRIRLRPRDQLKNIRDAFNRAAESLHDRAQADRTRAEEICAALDGLLNHAAPDEKHREDLRTLRDRVTALTRDWTI